MVALDKLPNAFCGVHQPRNWMGRKSIYADKASSQRPSLHLRPETNNMSSPGYTNVSPKDHTSPSNGADQRDEEEWSGDEDDEEGDDSRKRKRSRISRPISVSCELCKQRKVGFVFVCLSCFNLLKNVLGEV